MSYQYSPGIGQTPSGSDQHYSAAVPAYNNKVVKQFAIMTVVWGVVGMLVGVIIAAQLVWPELNVGPWLHFGRLRPLHTNAVIFAFGGCALFASSYYVVQRTSQAPLFSDRLAAFTFWGWQLFIVAAAITLPLGLTSAKEYAELEWPIDILIALVWGDLRSGVFWHHYQTPRSSYLCCQLVFRRLYYCHRHAAYSQ